MTRDKQLAAGALALVLFGGLAVKQFRDVALFQSRFKLLLGGAFGETRKDVGVWLGGCHVPHFCLWLTV